MVRQPLFEEEYTYFFLAPRKWRFHGLLLVWTCVMDDGRHKEGVRHCCIFKFTSHSVGTALPSPVSKGMEAFKHWQQAVESSGKKL